jgi:hypothetical protein
MKCHKVALGGSYSGDSRELFKNVVNDGILQFSLVGREVTMQVQSDDLEDIIKTLKQNGVSNLSILEWRKCGTTLAGSGCSADGESLLNVSLIPSTIGGGLRPLSVTHKSPMERNLYIELLANIEVVLIDAGVSDVLYALQIEKESDKEGYLEAVRDATLNALFNAGGVVGIE